MHVKLTGGTSKGTPVFAKMYKGKPEAATYCNRAQAQRMADKVGGEVIQPGMGRVFFVAVREESHA